MISLHEITSSYRSIDSTSRSTDHTPSILSSLMNWLEEHDNHCEFNQIYVFGDSLSDIGNSFTITQKATGEGLPPSPPYFEGRFSNGLVWIEYLAHLLKIPSDHHTNYATGGANTDSTNTYIPDNPAHLPGLQQQVDAFVTSLNQHSANPKGLYIVWAGANDYLSGSATNPTEAIANIIHAVQCLANVDARHILVANLPDLGDLPVATQNQRSAPFTALTQAHNSGLAAALQTLKPLLKPNTSITLLDVASLFKRVFDKPTECGFTNIKDIELEQLAHFQGYTDKFFFWDAIHPTTAAHAVLAQSAFALLQPTSAILNPTYG
ncbi:SGNH/GDSL hydrolase family protein [Leptolyngbya sp. FACHB-16]|nr:SGNH/GDSL hydrolase family protein [Leptolyngbya sp. FACHB-16]MBD2157266.1 SGNH/GDSL hydrolase family protein [Leptolyngbya sp. FACHB-16]